MSDELKPCPFCGGAASKDAYDRGIDIGCGVCGYTRHFPGLLQSVPNDKPIAQYRNGTGGITEIPPSEATEFYHADANERAIEAWNKRAPPSSHPAEGERQSIDTPEFKSLLGACVGALEAQETRRHVENVRTALIAHIDTWAGRSAGDAVPADQRPTDESNVMPPFAAPASRIHFDDATIESAALKHVATDWHLISHLIPNYRCTEQFARLKAFAEELASGFREGRNAKPETSSGAAHLVEQVGEQSSELKSALDAKAALVKRIKEAGMPPHSDFWDQSLWEADERIRKARQGQDSVKEGGAA
jgi:hypothetical protein